MGLDEATIDCLRFKSGAAHLEGKVVVHHNASK